MGTEGPTEGKAYATHQQLAGTWRPLDSAEQAVATNLLRYTSAMLRNRVPNLDQRIADGEIDPVLVELATIWVVRRVMVNPEAARQRSLTSGPFTHSITVDSALSSGALYVSDADLAIFLPVVPRGTKVGTARVRSRLRNWLPR